MKNLNLTTVLNIKIISIIVVLVMLSTAYNHWLTLQEIQTNNLVRLATITEFLMKQKPEQTFADAESTARSREELMKLLHEKMQPDMDNICSPISYINFGFYSAECENVVAVGPTFDRSLNIDLNSEDMFGRISLFTPSNARKYISEDNSLLWYGASATTYMIPVEVNGRVAGYAFASLNLDMVAAIVWKRTFNTLLGAVLMLILCAIFIRGLFLNLKKSLRSYAELILMGDANKYRSDVPEFTPIFDYLEEQTKRLMQLDRFNLIGEMAAGIAHELRNPMTTVRGFLQFKLEKGEVVGQEKSFRLMISELDRANRIITEYLSLSKNQVMEFAFSNLNNMLEDLHPMLQVIAKKNLSVIFLELDEKLPNIVINKDTLRQVIVNLVQNSLDAMPEGGKVTLSTKRTEAGVDLTFTDTGIGMPDKVKERIGMPFFTTKPTGTGLGMSICMRIVNRHHAKMSIDSTQGKGTTITLHFPFNMNA